MNISHFVVSVLQHSSFTDEHPAVQDLLTHSPDILDALVNHPQSAKSTLSWATNITKTRYAAAIRELSDHKNGWHFGAAHSKAEQLEAFRIENMARDIRLLAPELWDLIGLMLSADERIAATEPLAEDDPMVSDNDEEDLPKDQKTRAEKNADRRGPGCSTFNCDVMTQGTNQKCNALGSIFGIFLHASNTPSRVIEALAHMGISISEQSIEQESYAKLREMGQSLLVGYAYDNFDIDFHVTVPTVEKENLKRSEELWLKSPLNPDFNASRAHPPRTVLDLERLHLESDHPSGLTRRERFNAWKFREDILLFGPQYFCRFTTHLGLPEPIEQIPVKKMRHGPARSMDIKQSTVEGNIKAILNLLNQGASGRRNIISMVDYVILFHGDLGTGERINSILERRSLEATPWLRFQYVIYIMGLFHLKMACANAIWRIFIKPLAAREDVNSVMCFVGLHRQRETGKIGSDPGFRRMHEVITHEGVALRLDAWRVEVLRRNPAWTSLEEFAASKPPFEMDLNIYEVRQRPVAERDQQHENILQIHQYFLLYEEISWSMNYCDIGRIETCFPTWIYIFKATGKHKYASHMVKFMTDIHFVYPPPLR
ncbi:hypothetical protein K438DRAFT_1908311 [Mycena galopus ATCC 62051]|nr:hypothetical protein K438DRAFT_1908311 [Mycena galopus ATCC 62051]